VENDAVASQSDGLRGEKHQVFVFSQTIRKASIEIAIEHHRCSIIVEKMLKIRIPVQLPSLIRKKSFNEPEQAKDP